MKLFRIQIVNRLTALLTGLIFLNMSFFLAEVNALHLEQRNAKLLENIVKLITGIGYEEERDIFGESSSELSSKSIDLFLTDFNLVNRDFIQINQLLRERVGIKLPASSMCETFTPPPEV